MHRAILLLPAITGAWRERCGGAGYGLPENFGAFARPDVQRNDLGYRAGNRIVNMVQMGRALTRDIGADDEPFDRSALQRRAKSSSIRAWCAPAAASFGIGF